MQAETPANRARYREAQNKCQRAIRHLKTVWWTDRTLSNQHNTRKVFEGIKPLSGRRTSGLDPIDSATSVQLIQSYLLGRLQRVKCNGIVSDWLPFRCGVSQGSLLGPLLFNIFVNDVNYSAGFSSLRLYADDTTQYVSHECPALLESILNQDIKKLTIWFSANYLQVNATKTQSMTLGSSQYTYNF